MVSVTGPSEAWFVSGFDSLAAWEKDRLDNEKNAVLTAQLDQLGEKDGEVLSGVRSIVARYREDLSYRPGGVNIGQMRYFYVTTFRIRPGHENDYTEANKIVRAAHEKANVPEHALAISAQVRSNFMCGAAPRARPAGRRTEWSGL